MNHNTIILVIMGGGVHFPVIYFPLIFIKFNKLSYIVFNGFETFIFIYI